MKILKDSTHEPELDATKNATNAKARTGRGEGSERHKFKYNEPQKLEIVDVYGLHA